GDACTYARPRVTHGLARTDSTRSRTMSSVFAGTDAQCGVGPAPAMERPIPVELRNTARRVAGTSHTRNEPLPDGHFDCRAIPGEDAATAGLIGNSFAWREVLRAARRVASTETTVCLHGESGTGKEVVARFIHAASPRRRGPFVAINCAALPEHLVESELFG